MVNGYISFNKDFPFTWILVIGYWLLVLSGAEVFLIEMKQDLSPDKFFLFTWILVLSGAEVLVIGYSLLK